MKKNDFEKINSRLEKDNKKNLSNPRNAASGTIRNITAINEERNLYFIAYQLIAKINEE
jgi:NAD-dependent DNA ligase